MIKFGYTILYVKDVERSIAFYEKAFGLKRKFMAGDAYGELDTGATTLSFASIPTAQSNLKSEIQISNLKGKPFGIEIGFTTDDVEGTYQKAVAAGATEEAKASYKPHGQTVAYVRDPDGFLVEICTPMV
jgi:catechol 2,3-dioxygenase-like lactoylglutathione lyase family enzyme